MKYPRRLAMLVLPMIAVTALGAPVSAAPSSDWPVLTRAQDGARPENRYCVTVLKKLAPGQTESEVSSRQCANTPEVLNEYRSSSAQSVLLVNLYEHADFGGFWEDIRGDDGPCDAAGYGIPNFTLGGALSSYRAFGTCNNVRLYSEQYYNGLASVPFRQECGRLGVWNDLARSFWVWHGGDRSCPATA